MKVFSIIQKDGGCDELCTTTYVPPKGLLRQLKNER